MALNIWRQRTAPTKKLLFDNKVLLLDFLSILRHNIPMMKVGDLVRFSLDGNIWLVIGIDWSGAAELLRGGVRHWAMRRQVEVISEAR